MLTRLFVFFTLSLTFIACEGEDQTPSNNPTFNCEINGNSWKPTHFTILRLGEDTVQIDASNAAYNMSINGNKLGTYYYDLSAYSNEATIVDYNGGSSFYSTGEFGSSGRLHLDPIKYGEAFNTISGTFSFKAHKLDGTAINVTSGSFANVIYTE